MYYNYVSSYFMHVIAFFPKWNSKSVAYLFEDALELAAGQTQIVKYKTFSYRLFKLASDQECQFPPYYTHS